MKNTYLYSIILISCTLTGCVSTGFKDRYNETRSFVSVENGLPQIAQGFVGMKKLLDENNQQMGLYMDTVKLTTTLTADAQHDGKLGISADPLDIKSLSQSIFKSNASRDTVYKDLRGSTLEINFKSVNQYNLEKLDKLKAILETSAKVDSKKAEEVGITKEIIKKLIEETAKGLAQIEAVDK